MFLPREVTRGQAPPLKTQGIKTRLVPFIAAESVWDGSGRWVEPFVGSAAVALNLAPPRALLGDVNPHPVAFYRGIQERTITAARVREFLIVEGEALQRRGESHYYDVRARFNEYADPLDYLFLSRSCFNGLVRFNRSGNFNVPFCRKPSRFSAAYVTRIVNQVEWAASVIRGRDWTFVVQDWRTTLAAIAAEDFAYLDPPYNARHADFYSQWTDSDCDALIDAVHGLPCAYAYSTWVSNAFRANTRIVDAFERTQIRTMRHWYHVGSRIDLRHEMVEGLVVAECPRARRAA